MLYEPPKTKKYIIIFGVVAFLLAILIIVAAPLVYRNKESQAPIVNISPEEKAQQEKIKKEFEKAEEIQRNSKQLSPEEIQKEFSELEKKKVESNATQPSPEQIQEEFESLQKLNN